MYSLSNVTMKKQWWWWIMILFTSCQTWNHKLWSWYCPPLKSNIQASKAEVETIRRIALVQIQVEWKMEQLEENLNSARCHASSCQWLPITYSLCVQHCKNDKCVTSTCFKIIVNNDLVNTTEQPKGNMPDHVYHGNIKCFFVNIMYKFDMYSISSSTCIPVSLLDYLSVYYMISCYNI